MAAHSPLAELFRHLEITAHHRCPYTNYGCDCCDFLGDVEKATLPLLEPVVAIFNADDLEEAEKLRWHLPLLNLIRFCWSRLKPTPSAKPSPAMLRILRQRGAGANAIALLAAHCHYTEPEWYSNLKKIHPDVLAKLPASSPATQQVFEAIIYHGGYKTEAELERLWLRAESTELAAAAAKARTDPRLVQLRQGWMLLKLATPSRDWELYLLDQLVQVGRYLEVVGVESELAETALWKASRRGMRSLVVLLLEKGVGKTHPIPTARWLRAGGLRDLVPSV